jgi:Na+:H+ antiporter, NhaA family
MTRAVPRQPLPIPTFFSAVLGPLQAFFRFEAASGVLMVLAAALALVWANSPWSGWYEAIFHLPLSLQAGSTRADFSVHALVNDGLMTLFFFVVGMEIKRELVIGELSSLDRALLPAIAALGGMAAPALIYSAFNWGTPEMSGWAIPTATDIAFSIGVLTLLKRRIGWGLIVFLTALAIFDDMGGIAIIAVFYGTGIDLPWLAITAAVLAVGYLMGRFYVTRIAAWTVLGFLLWFCVLRSGIHPTISGVMLGLMVPSRSRVSGQVVLEQLRSYVNEHFRRKPTEEVTNQEILGIEDTLEGLEPPLNRFVHALQPWVSFAIVPVFALANSGVSLQGLGPADLLGPVPLGIALGLFVGKQLGIFAFTKMVVATGRAPQPGGGTNAQLWGVSIVGGIGFTVALFVAGLSFPGSPETLDRAKLGILAGSLVSAVVGYVMLRIVSPSPSRASAAAGGAPAAAPK